MPDNASCGDVTPGLPGSGAPIRVVVRPDRVATIAWTADWIVDRIRQGVEARGDCRCVLAGGSTPRELYVFLAGDACRSRIPWAQTHWYFGDERYVPREHPDSNAGMAAHALLDAVPVPVANVHPMPTGFAHPADAAAAYEALLRATFAPAPGTFPRFDLVLLGLGADGHTASLFPGSAVLAEQERWVAAPYVEHLAAHRLTLTLPVINAARAVLMLVTGDSKAGIVRAVVQGPPDRYPAQLVRPAAGLFICVLDGAAASGLARTPDAA